MQKDTLKKEIKIEKISWIGLLICLIVGIGIKLKFMFQGSLWPDEALYLFIARNLSADLTDLTSISGKAFYQSPPLLMYILSLVEGIKVVTFDQAARAVVILMAGGTIITTYFIGKKLYHPVVGIVAAALLAVCPLTNWTGIRILTDIPVVFFIYLAICMLVYEKKAAFYVFGVCAVLTKYSAFPVLFLPLIMRMKPKVWLALYSGTFIALFAFVTGKSMLPKPNGWAKYFYNFFNFPEFLHMFKEAEFFLGYFLAALIILGLYFTIKEKKYSVLFHWVLLFAIFRFFLPWIIFRVSRYTLPIYPGLYLFAAIGCYKSVKLIASRWPQYTKWASVCFVVAISSVFFSHSLKSLDLLNQTRNSFIGFDKASAFLLQQPGPHSVATASPRQVKYFGPDFDVHDIEKKVTPEKLRMLIDKRNIQYLSIDLWSPHLPEWCRSFNYKENGYDLIYKGSNVYVFKVL